MQIKDIYHIEKLGFKKYSTLSEKYKDIFIRYFYDNINNIYVKHNNDVFVFVDIENDKIHILRIVFNRDYSIEYVKDIVCMEQIEVATVLLNL